MRLSFRRRLILWTAAAVAVAIATASVATYVIVRAEMREAVDDGLREFAANVSTRPAPGTVTQRLHGAELPAGVVEPPPGRRRAVVLALPMTALGGSAGYAQMLEPNGGVLRPPGRRVDLPVTAGARAVAAGHRDAYFYETRLGGEDVRVYVRATGSGQALQAAQSLRGVQGSLQRLAIVLLAVTGAGIAAAVVLGRVVARAAARPVRELTAGAEYVTATQDLARRVAAPGDDELARLARSFNAMLAALEESRRAQRQLVADASHELRTPLSTVLANVEMLGRSEDLPAHEREQMRADLVAQLHELKHLVGDLVELARDRQPADELEEVDLGEVVAECLEKVRPHAGDVRFAAELDFSPVYAARSRVERAVVNLLDNARKYSPPGGRVEVVVRDGEVVVRDEGPGIADADRPHVFDRFYRAAESRALPGSGLGLAIGRPVAESHGGRAWVAQAPRGGAELHLRLSPAPAPPAVSAPPAVHAAAHS